MDLYFPRKILFFSRRTFTFWTGPNNAFTSKLTLRQIQYSLRQGPYILRRDRIFSGHDRIVQVRSVYFKAITVYFKSGPYTLPPNQIKGLLSVYSPSFRYAVRTKFLMSGLDAGQKNYVRSVKISIICNKSNLTYFFRILTSQKRLKNNFVP